MIELAPSILSADFSRLGEDVKQIENAGAHLIHVDVMDGHFVPNISYGATVMKSLCGRTQMPFDVHLMIENPDQYIGDFVTEQTEYITVHQEACRHINRTVQHIRSMDVKPGVAINPGTPVSALEYVLEDADLILIMSVNPGFGGQSYIPAMTEKIRTLRHILEEKGLQTDIEIDGGVDTKNLRMVIEAGANVLVSGSKIFGGDIAENVHQFKAIMAEYTK